MRVHGLENELGAELGESPTWAELAVAASLSPEEVLEARAAYRAARELARHQDARGRRRDALADRHARDDRDGTARCSTGRRSSR